MGCDIHTFVERKYKGDWVMIQPTPYRLAGHDGNEYTLAEHRDYGFFFALAGVRAPNGVKETVEPKGLPPDVSQSVDMHSGELWGIDAHSHSWEMLEDFINLYLFLHGDTAFNHKSFQEQVYQMFALEIRDDAADDPSNFRVVFWFDN